MNSTIGLSVAPESALPMPAEHFPKSINLIGAAFRKQSFEMTDRHNRTVSPNLYINHWSSIWADNSSIFPDPSAMLIKTIKVVVDGSGMARHGLDSSDLQDRILFAQKLEEAGKVSTAIDIIYREIDTRLRSGKILECNKVLRALKPESLSVHVIIGLLSITLAASKKLKSRPSFFAAARREIQRRGMDPKSLIDGLRGWRAANEKGVLARKAAN
jgi:hypothetical protein